MKLFLLISLLATSLLAACAGSQVSGRVVSPAAPADKLLVLVNGGGAMQAPVDSNDRQVLVRLFPALSQEIRGELSRRGVPSRVDDVYVSDRTLFGSLQPGQGERVFLLLSRVERAPDSRVVLWVQLLSDDPLYSLTWTAQVRLASLKDPKLDRESLRAVATELVSQMQRDRALTVR